MSSYSRFPHRGPTEEGSSGGQHENRMAQAERHFRASASPARTQQEKTSQAAKQIVQDQAEKRHTLTEALKAARLNRAERLKERTAAKTNSDSER